MFTDVINNPDYGYRLMGNIEDNFSEAGEFNAESILEIGYSVIEKPEFTGFALENVSNRHNKAVAPAGGAGGFRSLVPSAWLAVLYRNEKPDSVDPRNTVDSLDIAGRLVLDEDGNTTPILRPFSLRTSLSVALPDDFYTPYYQADIAAQKGSFNNLEYAYFRKYSNWRTVTTEQDFQPDFKSPLNVRLIRLADVYLMLAECEIAGGTNEGGVEAATELINIIRRRSGVQLIGLNGTGSFPANDHDNINYTASTLMEHLMYVERPLELAIEGQASRFLDLRRWGVIEDRFQELASRNYFVENVSFIDALGRDQIKFGALLSEGIPIDPGTGLPGDPDPRIKDNVRASENYIPSLHAYYPIPILERTSNPNVN